MNFISSLLISLAFTFVAVIAFHGQPLRQLQQRVRVPTSVPASALSIKNGKHLNKLVRLLSTSMDDAMIGNTVVSRCTKKIVDSLQPTECVVTSTDDDPNGSHVRLKYLI
jgi:hypothetical protein